MPSRCNSEGGPDEGQKSRHTQNKFATLPSFVQCSRRTMPSMPSTGSCSGSMCSCRKSVTTAVRGGMGTSSAPANATSANSGATQRVQSVSAGREQHRPCLPYTTQGSLRQQAAARVASCRSGHQLRR